MANYSEGQTATSEQVTSLVSSLSGPTAASIASLVATGVGVGLYGSDTAGETANVSGAITDEAAAVSNSKINSTFDNVKALVVSKSSGNVDASNNNNDVSAEFHDVSNMSASFGNGDNNLTFGGNGGNIDVSVETGNGNDDIGILGKFTGQITTGSGDLELSLDATAQEESAISVDAGEGFDLLKLLGAVLKHTFEYANGHFRMHSGNVQMDGVNVVATDMDNDGAITSNDHITVLAETAEDSLIAKLYKVALGREAIDGSDGWGDSTLGGINWWTNEYEKNNDITDHEQLVRAFLNCDEFHNKYDSMTDTQYVNELFSNLGVSDVEAAQSYIDQLANGSIDRETVAWQIATSETAVKVLGNDGQQYVIDGDFSSNA